MVEHLMLMSAVQGRSLAGIPPSFVRRRSDLGGQSAILLRLLWAAESRLQVVNLMWMRLNAAI